MPADPNGLVATLRRPDIALVQQALAQAAAAGALELRVEAAGGPDWTAAGFTPDAAGLLVRPLVQRLDGVGQTEGLGERLGRQLRAGDLVVLTGPLGAGKTALTRGIGRGLGVVGAVTSPTFVLARRHVGPVPLLHVDAYRLQQAGAGAEGLEDLDLDLALEEGVVVVEWGALLVEPLSASRVEVVLSRSAEPADQDRREATVRLHGPRWQV